MTRTGGSIWSGVIGAMLAAMPLHAEVPSAEPTSNLLSQRIAAISGAGSGRLGVAAQDLETGHSVSFSGADPFPMASTVKIAIAASYLAAVDSGRLSLDQTFAHGRHALTASQLMEAMLNHSNNGASDILLKAVGGPHAVDSWLEHAGIRGQRMDRTIATLVRDDRPPMRVVHSRFRDRHHRWHTKTIWVLANPGIRPAASNDTRDTSTPAAMITLLAKLKQGALLGEQSTAYLFDVMARCVTGPRRIKGMLPLGTPVAHKTGTLAGVSNDVGIVTLPNGHHLAVAIFAHGMASDGARNHSIAETARLLYDGFSAMEQGASSMAWGASR